MHTCTGLTAVIQPRHIFSDLGKKSLHQQQQQRSTNQFSCGGSSQVIQTVSAVDKDEPLSGHRFFFSLAAPVASNLNFTLRDNKGTVRDVFWCWTHLKSSCCCFCFFCFLLGKHILQSPELKPMLHVCLFVQYFVLHVQFQN